MEKPITEKLLSENSWLFGFLPSHHLWSQSLVPIRESPVSGLASLAQLCTREKAEDFYQLEEQLVPATVDLALFRQMPTLKSGKSQGLFKRNQKTWLMCACTFNFIIRLSSKDLLTIIGEIKILILKEIFFY